MFRKISSAAADSHSFSSPFTRPPKPTPFNSRNSLTSLLQMFRKISSAAADVHSSSPASPPNENSHDEPKICVSTARIKKFLQTNCKAGDVSADEAFGFFHRMVQMEPRYERFLKIMILSALKNTNLPVKFWFIKNYLSLKFKVIFVDADQIVRADVGELYDMDLRGRPLAYTPFCENNKDMDGYRFWRQGFWKEHLRGKPYHISALYVVYLKKFRETTAGDNLRVFYETLSKDPNSLANLDQDLPNYAQHAVPIFSLPQEWLWCESRCGNATKSKAKTIDLCNNPMTKEPKLQGARRIVSEWVDLDLEAQTLTWKILHEENVQEQVVAPDQEQNLIVDEEAFE